MRSFLALATVVVLLSHPLFGAQSATTSPKGASKEVGSSPAGAEGTTIYRNDVLHLAYTYPASFLDASATVGPAFQASVGNAVGESADLTRCVTLPFSAMSSANGLSIVVLLRADAACTKKNYTPANLPEFTRGEVQGLSASGARPHFGEPVSFTTGGHAAELLQGSFTLPTGQSMRALVACVLLKPDIACFQFLGSTDENLHTMSAFPVSFNGGAAQPLVPATTFAKP